MQNLMISKSTGSKSLLIVILCIILLVFAVTDLFLTAIIGHEVLLIANIDRLLLSIYSLILILEVIVALLVITFEIYLFKTFLFKDFIKFFSHCFDFVEIHFAN